MTIVKIINIVRTDSPIYYRRVYTGVAVIEIRGTLYPKKVKWTIETSPLGINKMSVQMVDAVDYPLVPVLKELKTKIAELDEKGILPMTSAKLNNGQK
jgi:uncharacterized protein YbbC (DUF1343 family)